MLATMMDGMGLVGLILAAMMDDTAMSSGLLVLLVLGAGDAIIGLIARADADEDEGSLMLVALTSDHDSWLGGCADDIMTGD